MFALARQLGTTVSEVESMSLLEYNGWKYLDLEDQNKTRKRESALESANEWLAKLENSWSQSAQAPGDCVAD